MVDQKIGEAVAYLESSMIVSGGLILVKAVLEAIPVYWMSLM